VPSGPAPSRRNGTLGGTFGGTFVPQVIGPGRGDGADERRQPLRGSAHHGAAGMDVTLGGPYVGMPQQLPGRVRTCTRMLVQPCGVGVPQRMEVQVPALLVHERDAARRRIGLQQVLV
jgi:hypothetical protein